ncbi:hypothetical protein BofuT4_uP145490.1 [Botrytis cinerea T4]|uniref:Uncharacterized protein n=1 Tax=Botryotinia fuckeliana (strain T4) TaxID=999810 RepID=G2YXN2_BOTF4|nr:hypothetical protein BofuT4_uP145490.1 [Botrytis cinerea T4]
MPHRKPQGKDEGGARRKRVAVLSYFTRASTFVLHSVYIRSILTGCVKQSNGE